jgi:hypothetical protein
MKGIHGLLLAVALGMAGALFNYVYLDRALRDTEMVGFVGVKEGMDVAVGERLTDEHLMEVRIPRRNVGNLTGVAYRYTAVGSVRGEPVSRPLAGGSLLLRQDLTTPRRDLQLGPDEAIIWVPIDTRSTVPSLIKPGDQVSFMVSTSRIGMPAPAGDFESEAMEPIPEFSRSSGPIETVGPFKVLSLGNRLGSSEVFKSARRPLVQENVIGILVELDNNGEMMPDARHLVDLLNATGNYPVGIMLHGRGDRSG